MTVQMTESDVIELVGTVAAGGVVLVVLLTALCIYLLVRPPRRRREPTPPPEAADSVDVEEMVALMERMERRLATLERAIEPPAPRPRNEKTGAARPTRRKQ